MRSRDQHVNSIRVLGMFSGEAADTAEDELEQLSGSGHSTDIIHLHRSYKTRYTELEGSVLEKVRSFQLSQVDVLNTAVKIVHMSASLCNCWSRVFLDFLQSGLSS